MKAHHKTAIRAILAMVGTIIGAGIFGIPAMVARTGVVAGSVVFAGVTCVVVATHLLYIEIIAHDSEKRRLPGYLGKILGLWGKRIGVFAYSCQLMGASFAYILLGGEFLAVIAAHVGLPDAVWMWQVLFWLGGIVIVTIGLQLVAKIESVLTWMLIALMLLMIALAFPQIDGTRFFMGNWGLMLAPLGVFLFALSGTTVIPEVHEMTGRNIHRTRWNVVLGTVLAAVLTWGFGVVIYAVMGQQDAANPMAFAAVFPVALWWLVPALGFFAVVTSFITSVFDLQAAYRLDFSMPRFWAWVLTLGCPLALLWIGDRNFLTTIGTIGALFTATTNILIVVAAGYMMHRQTRGRAIWWRVFTPTAIMLLFAGVILQRLSMLFE